MHVLEIGIKPLDFYTQSSKNRTSLQVLRYNDNVQREWRPSNRRGGEGIASPEAFLPWHHGCVACRRSCNAQPSYDLKLWNAVERSSPIPKISTRCFPAVLFFKEVKKHETTPVTNCCYVWLVWKLVELQSWLVKNSPFILVWYRGGAAVLLLCTLHPSNCPRYVGLILPPQYAWIAYNILTRKNPRLSTRLKWHWRETPSWYSWSVMVSHCKWWESIMTFQIKYRHSTSAEKQKTPCRHFHCCDQSCKLK